MADRIHNPLDIAEQSSSPSSPSSGYGRIYPKADGKMYFKNSSGDEVALTLSITQVGSLTLVQGSWSLVSGLYEYDLSNANITASSIVDVIPDNADIDIVKDAEVLPRTESGSGTVKLFAVNAPTGDIGVTINIWK